MAGYRQPSRAERQSYEGENKKWRGEFGEDRPPERDAPPAADRAALEPLAILYGRVVGAPREEVFAAVEAVAAALDHPLLRRAMSAQRCHRELPILFKAGKSRIIEGILDLAYLRDGTWTVIDFKTDAETPLDRYRNQLAWYVHALGQVTSEQVQGWLLSV